MKIFKKTVLSVCLIFSSVSNVLAIDELYITDLSYIFDYSEKKCVPLDFEMKKYFFNEYKKGNILINRKIDSVPGWITELFGKAGNKGEKIWLVTSSFGACRFYEDVIEKNMENVESKNYINLKPNVTK